VCAGIVFTGCDRFDGVTLDELDHLPGTQLHRAGLEYLWAGGSVGLYMMYGIVDYNPLGLLAG